MPRTLMLLGRISEEATSRRAKEALKMKRTAVRITKVQLMRPDFGNGAIHPDERRGYSGEDLYAVSDFEITHNNRSPSFQTGELQAWHGQGRWVVRRQAL